MAAFFDELGKMITQTGQDAVKKTKDFAEITKLNNNISTEQGRIHTQLYELGKAYYEANCDDETSPYADKMNLVKQSFAKIHEYNNEIKRLKGVRQCEQCGAEISVSATFCTLCGAKQTQENTQTQEQASYQSEQNAQGQALQQTNAQEQTFRQPQQEQTFSQGSSIDQPQQAGQSNYRVQQPEIVQTVCPNCGKTVSESAAFCTFCGTALK